MNARRTLSSLLFIAAIGLLGWWGIVAIRSQDRGPQLIPPREAGRMAVRVRTLEGGPARRVVDAYGTLLPAREARLAAEVAGRVVRLHPEWRPGGRVQAGDEILALDTELAELEVRRAEGLLTEAEAALRGAELRAREVSEQMPLVEKAVELASRELERLQGLAAVESEMRVDAARSARNAAQLERLLARERLGVASVEVEVATARQVQARTAVELAREQLARLVLRAPFDARFVGRPPGVGTYLVPGVEVARLVDVANLHLRLEVPEDELGGLREGLAARVLVPSRAELELPGRVRAVSVQADATLRALGVEIEIDNAGAAAATNGDREGADVPAGPLAAGQFARAEIEVEQLADVLVLSKGEFQREGATVVAHVVVDEHAGAGPRLVRREPRLGPRVRRPDGSVGFVVLAGLAPGEVLAVSPQDRLRDGAACTPLAGTAP